MNFIYYSVTKVFYDLNHGNPSLYHSAALYACVLWVTIWPAVVYRHKNVQSALYCTVLCCTVLCCTVLCCTILYCTVLYSTIWPEAVSWTQECTGWYMTVEGKKICDEKSNKMGGTTHCTLGYIVQSENPNLNFALSYYYVDLNSKASLFSWKKLKNYF